MQNAFTVTVERFIPARPDQVFAAWTTPELMREWLAPVERVEMDARPGGRFLTEMYSGGKLWPMVGEILAFDPPRLFEFRWSCDAHDHPPAIVRVEITPAAGGSKLRLTHNGIGSNEAAQESSKHWTGFLEVLDKLLEGLTATV